MNRLLKIHRMNSRHAIPVSNLEGRIFTQPWPYQSIEHEVNENARAHGWVAEYQNEIVGYIIGWCFGPEAQVGTFGVDPRYRRNRIGERLLSTLIKNSKSRSSEAVFLEVRKSNIAAQHLYSKHGFVVSGVRKHYYADNNEDALLMTLSLKEE